MESLTKSSLDRMPPQNIEAEQSILGALMLDKDGIIKVADIITPEDFYDTRHQLIYETMQELFERSVSIDILTVSNTMEEKKELEKIGGTSYLSQLVNTVPSATHITYYATIVRKKGTLRRLIKSAGEISSMAFSEEGDIEDILDTAEQKLFGVSQHQLQQNFIPVKNILHETFERIDELHRDKGKLRGLSTGFNDLDKKLGGLQKSDLVILAARPSMGKTAMALDIIRHVSTVAKIPTGIFSLEMSKDQLVDRLLAAQSDVDLWKIRTGNLTEEDFEKLNYGMGALSEAPLFIDDAAGANIMEIRTKARRLQAEHNVGLIVVDYLQLMAGRNTDNRVQEVSEISRSLKILARELNIPVIALSQLSRGVESRPDKVPQLADLRESGCLDGSSLVTLSDNRRVPMRDLVGKSGLKVWALNEQTLKLEPANLLKAFSTGTKLVYRLKTRLGRELRATANHKFRAISDWKRLDQLVPGEHIALPRMIPNGQKQTMTNDELALLGHLIGDGCTLARHAIQYTTREYDLAETVAYLASAVFKQEVNPRIKKENTWYQVYLTSSRHHTHGTRSAVAEWLDELNIWDLRSYQKFIPVEVFQQPLTAKATFLRHLWSTDGCIKSNINAAPAIYYASSSYQLAEDVQGLLLYLGINATLRSVPQNRGRTQYHVCVTGKPDVEKFIDLVGAVGEYKQSALDQVSEQIQKYNSNTNRDIVPNYIWKEMVVPAMQQNQMTTRQMMTKINTAYCGTSLYKQNVSRERLSRVATAVQSEPLTTLALSDVYWDQIISIEAEEETEVFDLTIENHHNFIANNIIVHNSIEQDADVVMFIYREDMYRGRESSRPNIAEIHIKKHRNGPTGQIDLFFDESKTSFRTLDQTFDTSPQTVMQSLAPEEIE